MQHSKYLYLFLIYSSLNIASAAAPQIDLLVVYSKASLAQFSSPEAIEQSINYAVLNTNLAYRNSGVNQRLRLVHSAPIHFPETDFNVTNDAVAALSGRDDGYLDDVHTLRDQYGADLVMLIADGDVWSDWSGGDAEVLYRNNADLSEKAAFSIVDWKFLNIGTAFPHELGHTMGLQHDWYKSADKLVPFTYARGYTNRAAGWRTLMAYDTACQDSGKDCPRVFFFSNPDINYQGEALGVAEGTRDNCQAGVYAKCDADARKTLNTTVDTVSAFREVVINTLDTPLTLAPSGTQKTHTPFFTWAVVPNASHYRVLIGIAPSTGTAEGLQDGTKILSYRRYAARDICAAATCSIQADVNFPNGNHYWSVQALASPSISVWSDAQAFTLFTTETPPSIEVQGLLPNAETDEYPVFYWQPIKGQSGIADVTHYQILAWNINNDEAEYETGWIEADALCNTLVCSKTSLKRLRQGNYLWRIKSKTRYNAGEYGVRSRFTTTAQACADSRNKLLLLEPYISLTLPNFCFANQYYAMELSLLLHSNTTSWALPNKLELISNGASCPSNSPTITAQQTHFSLNLPNACLTNNRLEISDNIRLNLDLTWGLEAR